MAYIFLIRLKNQHSKNKGCQNSKNLNKYFNIFCHFQTSFDIFIRQNHPRPKDVRLREKNLAWQDWDVSGKNYDRWGKFGMHHNDDNLLHYSTQE